MKTKKSIGYILQQKRGVYFHGFAWEKQGHPATFGPRKCALLLRHSDVFGGGQFCDYPSTRDLKRIEVFI